MPNYGFQAKNWLTMIYAIFLYSKANSNVPLQTFGTLFSKKQDRINDDSYEYSN